VAHALAVGRGDVLPLEAADHCAHVRHVCPEQATSRSVF
jgi:hypothetical protein